MKTTSREALLHFFGKLLMVAVLAGGQTIKAEAAEADSLANMSAGAAEVLNSVDEMTEAELTDFAQEYEKKYSLVMANVSDSMNIRQEPHTGAEIVGLLYTGCGATILERGDGWTKIQSGNLVGWAHNDYLLFAEEALELSEEVGVYNAIVQATGLNIRKEPSTDAGILDQADSGAVYETIAEHTTDEWVAISYGGETGYLSADYVTMDLTVGYGETFVEIAEREKREMQEKQQMIVEQGTSAIGTTEEKLLAALIYLESGNQPYEGQVAVGAVVMNRVKNPAYPNTIAGVIYAPSQFSPAVTGRVEELAVQGVPDSCLQAARAAMNGESPVGGALNFRRAGQHQGQVIADHVFW